MPEGDSLNVGVAERLIKCGNLRASACDYLTVTDRPLVLQNFEVPDLD